MMNSKNVILTLDGEELAVARNASVELSQGAEEWSPIQGSDDDDGWRHYRNGTLAWSLSQDHLVVEDSADLITKIMSNQEPMDAVIDFAGLFSVSGDVLLQEVGIEASVHAMSFLSAKFICNGFPSINITTT